MAAGRSAFETAESGELRREPGFRFLMLLRACCAGLPGGVESQILDVPKILGISSDHNQTGGECNGGYLRVFGGWWACLRGFAPPKWRRSVWPPPRPRRD